MVCGARVTVPAQTALCAEVLGECAALCELVEKERAEAKEHGAAVNDAMGEHYRFIFVVFLL